MIMVNVPTWLPADARKRRSAAMAILLLLIGLIVAAIAVPAILLHRRYDENIAKLSRQVTTQTAFNTQRPRLAEKLQVLKARDVRKLFLKGTSPALALAELQEIVRTTIETSGGAVVSSVQGNVPKEDGAYKSVSATFSLSVNNTNLRRLLYTLETREPYLFIDTLSVSPQIASGFRPAPGAAEPSMFVQLEVHAFSLRSSGELVPPVSPQAGANSPPGSTPLKGRSQDGAVRDKGGAT